MAREARGGWGAAHGCSAMPSGSWARSTAPSISKYPRSLNSRSGLLRQVHMSSALESMMFRPNYRQPRQVPDVGNASKASFPEQKLALASGHGNFSGRVSGFGIGLRQLVVHPGNTAWFVREQRPDDAPLIVAEFIPYDLPSVWRVESRPARCCLQERSISGIAR